MRGYIEKWRSVFSCSPALFSCIRDHPWQKRGFPMRVNRAYVDRALAVGARVALPEGAAAHLLRVLRLDVGDGCVLFNGDGHDYDARVVAAGKRGGEVEVTGRSEEHTSELQSLMRISYAVFCLKKK